MNAREPLADGVYVGLSLQDYLADEALGASDLKKLAVNPPDAMWEKPSNPLWDEPESDAKDQGTLAHIATLEGLDVYEKRYAAAPDRSMYPGALDTNAELKDWMKQRGVKPLTGDKAELITRIKASCGSTMPVPPIWADIVAKHVGDRIMVSEKTDKYVRLVRGFLHSAPDFAGLLTAGMCELSIFWTITHQGKRIRCKARPDRLRADGITELKKFGRAPMFGRDLQTHLQHEAEKYQYHVQAVWQMRALEALRNAGTFAVTAPSSALAKEVWALINAPGERDFTWIFVRMPGAPCAMALDFGPKDAFGNTEPAWENAQEIITTALDGYLEYRERFGSDIWMRPEGRRRCDPSAWPFRITYSSAEIVP